MNLNPPSVNLIPPTPLSAPSSSASPPLPPREEKGSASISTSTSTSGTGCSLLQHFSPSLSSARRRSLPQASQQSPGSSFSVAKSASSSPPLSSSPPGPPKGKASPPAASSSSSSTAAAVTVTTSASSSTSASSPVIANSGPRGSATAGISPGMSTTTTASRNGRSSPSSISPRSSISLDAPIGGGIAVGIVSQSQQQQPQPPPLKPSSNSASAFPAGPLMGSAAPMVSANTMPQLPVGTATPGGNKDQHHFHLFPHKHASAPQLGQELSNPSLAASAAAAMAFTNHTGNVANGAASLATATQAPTLPGTGDKSAGSTPESTPLKGRISSDEEHDNEIIQYVTKEKLERFYKYFPDMPETEDLILAKSCALEREVLIAGDLFVTRNFVCFGAKFFGKKVLVTMPVRSISKIEKKKFGFIQNAIKIEAKDGTKMHLASLSKRDAVYDFLKIIWSTTMDPAFPRSQMDIDQHLQGLEDDEDDDTEDSIVNNQYSTSVPTNSTATALAATSSVNPTSAAAAAFAVSPPSQSSNGGTVLTSTTIKAHDQLQKRRSAGDGLKTPETIHRRKRSDSASSVEGMKQAKERLAAKDRETTTVAGGATTPAIGARAVEPAAAPTNTIIHALDLEKGDFSKTKPEKIFRNSSLHRGSQSSSTSGTTQAADQGHKQKIILMAKQKSKKLERESGGSDKNWVMMEEPLVSQKTLINEVFTGEAQDVYRFLYHNPAYPGRFTRRKDIHRGAWEVRDGVRVRENTFNDTIKLPSRSEKDEVDRYVLAKFREFQQVLVEEVGRYQITSEITSSHPEVHEGVVVGLETTITAEGRGRCRVSTSCKLKFPKASVSKVVIDSLFDIMDTTFRDIAETIRHNFVVVEKVTPPVTPSPSSSNLAAPHPFSLDPKILIVAGLGLLIFLFALWWTSSSTPALSEEDQRWIAFLEKSHAGSLGMHDSISTLFEQYQSVVVGGARKELEKQLTSVYERFGRFKDL